MHNYPWILTVKQSCYKYHINLDFGREESRGCVFHHLFRDILHGHIMNNTIHLSIIISNGATCGKLLLNLLQGLVLSCVKHKGDTKNRYGLFCLYIFLGILDRFQFIKIFMYFLDYYYMVNPLISEHVAYLIFNF